MELPESMAIEVVEESPQKLYIVIPPKPTGELTDEQLEMVAGGVCIPLAVIGTKIVLEVGLEVGVAAWTSRGRGW